MPALTRQQARPRRINPQPRYPRAAVVGACAVAVLCGAGFAACDPPWESNPGGDIAGPYGGSAGFAGSAGAGGDAAGGQGGVGGAAATGGASSGGDGGAAGSSSVGGMDSGSGGNG